MSWRNQTDLDPGRIWRFTGSTSSVKRNLNIRRIAALVGLLCFVAVPGTGASATTRGSAANQLSTVSRSSMMGGNPSSQGVAVAVVTGVNASSIPISISVGNPVPLSAPSGAEYSVTAVVGMGQKTDSIQPKSEFSGDTCGYDGSYAVYECVTMYYNIKSNTYNWFADNVQDSVEATNEDPHDVVLSNLLLTTGGDGWACSGSSILDGSESWNFSSPSSGTAYSKSPSWTGNYYLLDNSYGEGPFQNVQGTLTWDYRGNVEHLMFTYTLPNSESGWPQGGCSNNG